MARKVYDREFKDGAVRLVTEQGKSVPQVAKDLGISENSLYKWIQAVQQHGATGAFPGSGKLRPDEEEVRRLREENRILRMERDLLKKTLPLFMERQK